MPIITAALDAAVHGRLRALAEPDSCCISLQLMVQETQLARRVPKALSDFRPLLDVRGRQWNQVMAEGSRSRTYQEASDAPSWV